MSKFFYVAGLWCAVLAAVFPFAWLALAGARPADWAIAALNLVACLSCIMLIVRRWQYEQRAAQIASELGIDVRLKSPREILSSLIVEVRRRHEAIATDLFEKSLASPKELSQTLQTITHRAYQLLGAESAELALFDEDSGMYHSSFVLGKPFRISAQAMLSGAMERQDEEVDISPDVLVQPIAFAGSVMGTLRVALRDERLPNQGDREIISLLALQGGLALLNAEYSEQLIQMKVKSEESVRAKTGFLANLSHELRGPLGIMLNAVELVLDGLCGAVNEDQLETLRMVHGNGEHLLELINDVLDYAKVESGKIVPDPKEMLVGELIADITAVVRGQAEGKSHRLVCNTPQDALAIACDRRHIRQMLINLLTNAIKYTPEGGQIDVWAERAPGNKVKICVRDSGVGIRVEDRPKVFSAFERIENSYSINQIGTGLGMPLTRKLALVNGGGIDFSSEPGKGSVFWLVFDAVDPNVVRLEEESNPFGMVEGQGELLLLVGREEGEIKMFERYLTHVGFRVASVHTKIEATEILRHTEVALVILDNNVADNPDENLVSLVRTNAKSPSMPLILVSSRAFVHDVEKYLRSGVDRHLSKPVDLKELAYTCRHLIDGSFTAERHVAESTKRKAKDGNDNRVADATLGRGDIAH